MYIQPSDQQHEYRVRYVWFSGSSLVYRRFGVEMEETSPEYVSGVHTISARDIK